MDLDKDETKSEDEDNLVEEMDEDDDENHQPTATKDPKKVFERNKKTFFGFDIY
jgi:hypothetical protein